MKPEKEHGYNGAAADEHLMIRIAAGEEAAFNALYARYAGRLYAFLLKMLANDREKASDILQDLFLMLIEHPGRFDPGRRFSSWIFTVAANRCRNEVRTDSGRREVLSSLGKLYEPAGVEKSTGGDTERFRERLNAVLEEMPAVSRMLFLLRFQQELPVSRIALIMQLPEGTVKSRLHYLMRELAAKLKAYHPYK